MSKIYVQSSAIESVAHEGETLTVNFRNGGSYEYDRVSKETFDEFLAAPSMGRYFQANFRKLPYRKVK